MATGGETSNDPTFGVSGMRLYHFTSHLWWRFIKDEGITKGEAP